MSSSNAFTQTGPSGIKRQRVQTQPKGRNGEIWGHVEAEAKKNRKALDGGVTVAQYLLDYKCSNENADVDLLTRVLKGMTITKAVGTSKKRYTCKGVVVEGRDGQPKLDLGLTRTKQEPVLASISDCDVYMKDNGINKRLRRIVTRDNLSEGHYLENKHLRNKWQLVYLGQENPTDTLEKFKDRVVEKCGDANGEVIYITKAAELAGKLSSVDKCSTEVLLCVMEKKDEQLKKALKREAELERKLMTKCCELKTAVEDLKAPNPTGLIKSLGLEMVAKTGAYNKKALLLNSPAPPPFHGKVMYLGCHVSTRKPRITVMVGNMGASDRCAGEYQCRVAQGEYSVECFGEMFRQLREKYKEKNRFLPERIILFREGHVPHSVHDNLVDEVDALKRVKVEGGAGGDVRITLFVYQKMRCNEYVPVADTKCMYGVYIDENGFIPSQLQTLVDNLSYSDRYWKPLPAIYANKAAELAEIYLEGKNGKKPDLDEVAETIDRSLYVIGERDDTEGEGTQQVVVDRMEVENN